MQARRWTAAALTALLAATVPGALQLASSGRSLERSSVAIDDSVLPRPERTNALARPAVDERAAPASPAPTAPPANAPVPIAPPPVGELVGETAPVVATSAPFRGASYREPGAVYALVVGIDDYPGPNNDLDYAVEDANDVDAALGRFAVPTENRVVLRDGQAHQAAVVGALQALVDRAGAGSTLVLAFAGHIRKVDGDTEEMITADGGTIRDYELAALLAPSRASRSWVLLASCYAGGFTEILRDGMVLTAAADADSLAYESPSLRGSFLIHHMVREGWLEGRSGPSVQSAFAFAQQQMRTSNPGDRSVQYDASGVPLRLDTTPSSTGGGGTTPPPSAPTSEPSSPPPDDPTDEPVRECSLIVLCRRS